MLPTSPSLNSNTSPVATDDATNLSVAVSEEPLPPPGVPWISPWLWPSTLFAVWIGGGFVLGGFVIVTSRRLSRQLASAKPLEDPRLLDDLRAGCVRFGIKRAPVIE